MIFHLPYPVSTNTYYRNFRGRMVISAKGREFKAAVADIISDMGFNGFGDARIGVTVILSRGDKRSYDIDNFGGKSLLDALAGAGVFNNDSQIDELFIKRGPVKKPGSATVIIEEIKHGS